MKAKNDLIHQHNSFNVLEGSVCFILCFPALDENGTLHSPPQFILFSWPLKREAPSNAFLFIDALPVSAKEDYSEIPDTLAELSVLLQLCLDLSCQFTPRHRQPVSRPSCSPGALLNPLRFGHFAFSVSSF